MEIKDKILKLTEQLPNVVVGKTVKEVIKMNLSEKEFLEKMEQRLSKTLELSKKI